MNREKMIIKTSIIGILTNIALVIFKMFIGLISNSIAVILDAVNNLSDVLSSVVTILGAKLAAKKPDRKHPLGHGRYEYLSTLLVSGLILYAGITSLIESIKKIINPVIANYAYYSLIIIGTSIFVKIFLGNYYIRQGKKINSSSLIVSGKDALFDVFISSGVFLSALINFVFSLSLEAYLGILISIYIIYSSIQMFRDTINDILGKRIDGEFSDEIKKTICENEIVEGAYDLILHNYGPDSYIGSVHISIPDSLNAEEIDILERDISNKVYEKHGVLLTAIGIYSINTKDKEINKMSKDINRIIHSYDGVLQTHGFYVDNDKKIINIDIILDFDVENREELFKKIMDDIQKHYPEYTLNFTMDLDI